MEDTRPWADLADIKVQSADLVTFADGSCTWNNGLLKASYAVVTSHETLDAYVLSGMKLAHAAELIAVPRAVILGLQVNR